jgi:hypothetical protein
VKARWLLCTQDNWRAADGLFDLEVFFNILVELFESDPDDPWCEETLEWWNTFVRPIFYCVFAANYWYARQVYLGSIAQASRAPAEGTTLWDMTTVFAQRLGERNTCEVEACWLGASWGNRLGMRDLWVPASEGAGSLGPCTVLF